MSVDELLRALREQPSGADVFTGDSWGEVIGVEFVDGCVVLCVAGLFGVSDARLAGDVPRVGRFGGL